MSIVFDHVGHRIGHGLHHGLGHGVGHCVGLGLPYGGGQFSENSS